MSGDRYELQPHTRLTILDESSGNRWEITVDNLAGTGASCLVYQGTQQINIEGTVTQRRVIIKEFYPLSLSRQIQWDPDRGMIVAPEFREEFDHQLRKFCEGQAQCLLYANRNSSTSLPGPDCYGRAMGTFFSISPGSEGSLLSDWKSEEHTLADAMKLAASICDAIYRIHRDFLVYQDCKPDNIHVDQNCNAFLFDFNTLQKYDQIIHVFYTEKWAAPEQLASDGSGRACTGKIGFHTDVYGIGAVIFFLLTGHSPSKAELTQLGRKPNWRKWITAEDPNGVLQQEEFCSELTRVMGSALEPDPDRRRQEYSRSDSTQMLGNEFRKLSRLAQTQPAVPPVRRKKRLLAIAAIPVLILAVVLSWAYYRTKIPHQPDFISQGTVDLSGVDTQSIQLRKDKGQFIPYMNIEIQVSPGHTRKWGEQRVASQGDVVRFRIHCNNLSDHSLKDVICRALLPDSLTYIPGSTTVANSNHPKGVAVSDNLIKNKGINIGDYAPGEGAWIYFNARVNIDYPQTDNMILRTVIQTTAGEGTMEDTADVLVNKPGPLFLQMQASSGESNLWQLSAQVQEWTEVRLRMYFKNTSDEQLNNLVLRAELPERLEYVPDSTVLCAGGTGGKEISIPDGVTKQGAGLGAYGPGADGYLIFRVRVKNRAATYPGYDPVTAHLSGGDFKTRDSVEIGYIVK